MVRLCRTFGWTWDYVEEEITLDRIVAIQTSIQIFPPEFEMVTFVAYANGYQKAKDKAAEEEARRETAVHHGGAIVALFPKGVIRI